jgi:hypothetical protein
VTTLVRACRVLLVAIVLATGAFATRILLPTGTVACSCVVQNPNQPFDGSEDAVLVGTVGAQDHGGKFTFRVERWFKGGLDPVVLLQSATQPMGDGTFLTNTCGLELMPGQRLVLAAARTDAEGLFPGLCQPSAAAASPEGQALVAAAVRVFGEGVAPGAPPDPKPERGFQLDLSVVAMAALGLILLAGLLTVVVATMRREPPAANEP